MTISSATIHEAAGRTGALPSRITQLSGGSGVMGKAFTVQCPPYNNLWLLRSIETAPRGAIIVATTSGAYDAGYWGELMTHAAVVRGIRALVIDGKVRDLDRMRALGFPVFARGTSVRGTRKDAGASGAQGAGIQVGIVRVQCGDMVVADRDGVVIVPAGDWPTIRAAARARDTREERIAQAINSGASLLTLLALTSGGAR
jgi:4-hydroxy-4-methyl-2-oxoglutarate aldolase